MSHPTAWNREEVQEDIRALQDTPGALLPLLHAIQDRIGFIPDAAVPMIARALRQTPAEVYGVITFYHHFRRTEPGTHVLQLCRAEACQARGAAAVEAHLKSRLAIDYHQTSADGSISLEPVYCLGNCACGPSLRVGDRVLGRVSADSVDQLLDTLLTPAAEMR